MESPKSSDLAQDAELLASEQAAEGNETLVPPQYRGLPSDVVEELWQNPIYTDQEKNIAETKRREAAINEIKRQESLKSDQKQVPTRPKLHEVKQESELEKYKTLPNIEEGLKKLQNRLAEKNPDWKIVQKNIYDMLTTRSRYTQMVKENGDLIKTLEKFQKERDEYNNLVRAWESPIKKWIDSSNEFKWENTPGWFGINTRPEAPKREDVSIKAYATIPIEQHNFVQHLPVLAQELRKLSIDTDDIIHVKVPENFATFISKNDSVVIHYKNSENGEKIQEILHQWMSQNGIQEEAREMNRVITAADSKDTSFTDLVATNIANWLKEHHGKFDSNVLAELAVEHAIKQSQQPPEIKEKQ